MNSFLKMYFTDLFRLQGRMGRREFLWATFIGFILLVGVKLSLSLFLAKDLISSGFDPSTLQGVNLQSIEGQEHVKRLMANSENPLSQSKYKHWNIFYLFFSLWIFLGMLTASVRRLHDTDRSGWWWLLLPIPFINLIPILFSFGRGDFGPNKYGQPQN